MAAENMIEAPITVLDLFSGCGGLSEGFHQFRPVGSVGPAFQTLGAVEWEPAAAASYQANFGAGSAKAMGLEPPEVFCRDIVGWEPQWGPGEVDVVVGGPPCQGFSGLNRNRVRAERNKLWQEFIRVVTLVQPKVFVIENVDRFVRSPEFADLNDRIGSGDLKNYRLVEAPGTLSTDSDEVRARRLVLNAADFGAAQARRRAIVIGVRTDGVPEGPEMTYPAPTHSRVGDDGKAPWRTIDEIFEATADLSLAPRDLPQGRTVTYHTVPKTIAGPFLTTELHIRRNPEPISIARYEAIPTGGNRKDLRGRYRCTVESGPSFVLQKEGRIRNDDGLLMFTGSYRVVKGGEVTDEVVTVGPWNRPRTSSGKAAAPSFDVELVYEGEVLKATLEYLSTKAWDEHDAGAGDVMGRMRLGAPSVTIRTEFFKPEKGRYLHPTQNRPITHLEAARLQGFPDDFRWCGSKIEIARQIGNAVPIPLGARIAESIHEYLRASRGTEVARPQDTHDRPDVVMADGQLRVAGARW